MLLRSSFLFSRFGRSFIQFFFAYEAFVLLPRAGFEINLIFVEITAETRWLTTRAWAGALVVLLAQHFRLHGPRYSAARFGPCRRAIWTPPTLMACPGSRSSGVSSGRPCCASPGHPTPTRRSS